MNCMLYVHMNSTRLLCTVMYTCTCAICIVREQTKVKDKQFNDTKEKTKKEVPWKNMCIAS